MIGDRSEIPRLQSDFYRDQFYKVVRWLMISVVMMFILIALIIYFILFQPQQKYYGNTMQGRIYPMPAATYQ